MPGTVLPFMGIFGEKKWSFFGPKNANNSRTVPGRVYVPIGRIRGLNDNSHVGLKDSNNF